MVPNIHAMLALVKLLTCAHAQTINLVVAVGGCKQFSLTASDS